MPRNNGICSECEEKDMILFFSSYKPCFFSENLEELNSPIVFKGKKHTFKNCLELERDRVSETTEWHICKEGGGINVICERIYDKDEEYCAKHNRECQYYQCGTRKGVNSESYCRSHAEKCNHCQVRVRWTNNEGFCSKHQNKCKDLTCKTRTDKEYCSQHAYECQMNKNYNFYVKNNFNYFSCSERVVETYRYCSKHRWACENFRCPNRRSCSKSICDSCVNTDLCLEDCGTRIPKYTLYCSNCQKKNELKLLIKREQDQLKSLVKQKTSIVGDIEEVTRFTTWWNKENIATIITEINNSYWVFLGVIDRKPNSYGRIQDNEIFVYPANHSEAKWGIYSRKEHNSLSAAQSEASWLKTKLNGDNPILVIHPLANSYTSFTNIICEPYVRKEEIGSASSTHCGLFVISEGWTPSNLDNHFKIGDIIWVEKRDIFIGKKYFHVGIFLGKDSICHISDPNALILEENMKARITGWNVFLNKRTGELYHYHPIIPFKHYRKIIEQVSKSWCSDYGLNKYDLYNDNCEHFANAIVLGIYYSEQIRDLEANHEVLEVLGKIKEGVFRTGGFYWDAMKWIFTREKIKDYKKLITNNSKGLTICLRNELKSWDSNGRFDNLNSNELRDMRDRYENEYKAQIEQPVNINNCIIM